MEKKKPQYMKGLVRLPLENRQFIDLSPQECWELIEKARLFLIYNFAKFDQPPIKYIKKNNKSFKVTITKWVDWWKGVENSSWEPNTFNIFDDFISFNCIYLDIGAWIGPTTLYAAQLAKRTYAFEPDPIAYQELETNIHANKGTDWASRITIYNKAIAPISGTVKMGSIGKKGGGSGSSTLFASEKVNWEAEAITLKQFVESENIQNEELFIKMDIEGGEYELIPKLKREFTQYDVDVHLSIHPTILMNILKQRKKNSMLSKIMRRLLFAWYHIKLLNSLSFKYLYDENGRPVNFYTEILKALLKAKFPRVIVATNRKWDSK